MNLHRATSTHAIHNGSYNSSHIQEVGGGYMPTKITGLHTHLQKQTDFLALTLKPLAHQYEPLYLRKPLWSASPSPLGNKE